VTLNVTLSFELQIQSCRFNEPIRGAIMTERPIMLPIVTGSRSPSERPYAVRKISRHLAKPRSGAPALMNSPHRNVAHTAWSNAEQ
jgi:hypothetical protein